MLNQSRYSPVNSSRYQKSSDNIGFSAFQVTTQMNKRQLAEFRKEVRDNILHREPFVEHQQKSNYYLGNWGKRDRPTLDQLSQRRTPTSKIPGGLNYDEILQHSFIFHSSTRRNEAQSKADALTKLYQADKGPHIQVKVDSFFDNPFTIPTRMNTLGSGYKDSPQKSQQRLERFKSWDSKLDVQLKLQNKAISNKVLGEQPGFYKYINEAKQGLLDQNYTPTLSVRNKNSFRDQNQIKDLFSVTPRQNNSRHVSPQFTNKNAEKIPLTDIVRMTSHFSSLSTQEVKRVSSGYFQELINLQQSLQRMISLGTKNY
ncbi:unnamed protein product (macronuclear) [Paramecium tetraurelia]|uniref:Enkurin domain-containing protein n=1 Tax=Paramecium tetraurelia TaxID=5888 RepID=A0BIH9_PARTE|nr:uncharacterized protein GSPATT00004718001 [Paramecium tetraurelia]CAK58346.1 unnamed protein product [Paramecium tetraurelia]|eukprot:XP_001425744.1 hypothetical protein (macronuclear) [Paramecium tetraurelia strain d4-2]